MGVDVAAAGSGVGSVLVVGEGDAWRPEVKRVQRDRDCPLKSPRSAAERKRTMVTSYDFQRSAWPQCLAVLLLLARFFIFIFLNFRIYEVILNRLDMCPCT